MVQIKTAFGGGGLKGIKFSFCDPPGLISLVIRQEGVEGLRGPGSEGPRVRGGGIKETGERRAGEAETVGGVGCERLGGVMGGGVI
jgi:hypothetical protein